MRQTIAVQSAFGIQSSTDDERMNVLLAQLTVALPLAGCAFGWTGNSFYFHQLPASATAFPLQNAKHHQSPSLFRSSHVHALQAQKEKTSGGDGGGDSAGPTVLYNDDAFGLVFLSALFVAKDYTFAACFGLLSMVAAIVVQFGGIKFQTTLPGFVAIASFLVAVIVANIVGTTMEQVAVPTELAACAVSLVWGFVQATKKEEKST